jgi:hypothetical protein
MYESDGHQCQSRRSKPRAIRSPSWPSGSGGIGRGERGGFAGSPVIPEQPIQASFRS